MFSTLTDFIQTWDQEAEATQRILDALSNASLQQAISEEDRTIGRIAWHIVTTIPEMMTKTGLEFAAVSEDAPVPDTAQEIAAKYRGASTAMLSAVREQWTDQTLTEERDMYGEAWSIAKTLQVLVLHQVHHRGQITVLMRQAGLKVPGVYGPAREDWSAFGAEPPLV